MVSDQPPSRPYLDMAALLVLHTVLCHPEDTSVFRSSYVPSVI